MKKIVGTLLTLVFAASTLTAQLSAELDSLLNGPSDSPFNGVVVVAKEGKMQYYKTFGTGDSARTRKVKYNDKFVIGSISKQFTAVLVLQQYEKGKLRLEDPINKYLSNLPKEWQTITIHHLLTHMHGYVDLRKPLAFKPGTRFMYSQHGFELLAQILEKVTQRSFPEQSRALFNTCMMKNTSHPYYLKKGDIVTCFTRQPDGTLKVDSDSLAGFVAAGGFVSTAADLAQWNKCLFEGRLLHDSTLKLMVTPKKDAVREHPVFGRTLYGYGITTDTTSGHVQWGQTGFADGFATMNFYFPETKTSVIVLENIVYYPEDFRKTYFFHTRILEIVRKNLRQKRN